MAQPTKDPRAKDGVESTTEKKSVALEDYFYLNPMTQDQFQIKELNDITDEANKQLLREYINWRKNKMLIDATQTQADSVVTDTKALDQFINSREEISEEQRTFLEEKNELIEQYAETSQNAIKYNPEVKETFQKLTTSRGQPQILKTGKYNSKTGRFTVSNRCGYKSPESVANSLLMDGIASVGLPMNIKLERGSQKRKLLAIAKLCEKKGIDPSQIKIESTYFNGNLSGLTYANLNVTSTNLSPTLRAAANEKQDENICQPKLKGGIAHAFDPDYQKAEQLLSNPTNHQIYAATRKEADKTPTMKLLKKIDPEGKNIADQFKESMNNRLNNKILIGQVLLQSNNLGLTYKQLEPLAWDIENLNHEAESAKPIDIHNKLNAIIKKHNLPAYAKTTILSIDYNMSKGGLAKLNTNLTENINAKYFSNENSNNVLQDLNSGSISNSLSKTNVNWQTETTQKALRNVSDPDTSMFKYLSSSGKKDDYPNNVRKVNTRMEKINKGELGIGHVIQSSGINIGENVVMGDILQDMNTNGQKKWTVKEQLKAYNLATGKNRLTDSAREELKGIENKTELDNALKEYGITDPKQALLTDKDCYKVVNEEIRKANFIANPKYKLPKAAIECYNALQISDEKIPFAATKIYHSDPITDTTSEVIIKELELDVNEYTKRALQDGDTKALITELKKNGSKLVNDENYANKKIHELRLKIVSKAKKLLYSDYGIEQGNIFTYAKPSISIDDAIPKSIREKRTITPDELKKETERAVRIKNCYDNNNYPAIAKECYSSIKQEQKNEALAITMYTAVYDKIGDPATARTQDVEQIIEVIAKEYLQDDASRDQQIDIFKKVFIDSRPTAVDDTIQKAPQTVSTTTSAENAEQVEVKSSHAGTIRDFENTLKALRDKTREHKKGVIEAQNDNHQNAAENNKPNENKSSDKK